MRHAPPFVIVLLVLLASLTSSLTVLWLAINQPWLGLTLSDAPGQGLLVAGVDANGPSVGKIEPGDRLVDLTAQDQAGATTIRLRPQDMIEEPDTLATPDLFREFMQRQDMISSALQTGTVSVRAVRAADAQAQPVEDIVIAPLPRRPLSDLSLVFWVQLAVGAIGLVLGGWVMALRRNDLAVQCFVLAGLGLMLSAHAAAVYSTRELALPLVQFSWLSWFNLAGTLTFGIGMINLFLIYPARLAPPAALWTVAAVFAVPCFAAFAGGPDFLLNRQIPIASAMLLLLIVILVQVVRNRRNPTARAMLGWFGLSVLIGAGGFGVTITLPILLGAEPSLSQGYAFLFFLVIYAGLALGIARYRLFDLSEWSFRILFYIGGVILLLALDAALIVLLALDRAPALGVSLALVGLIYLPLRDSAGRWIRQDQDISREDLFALVTEVTLASDAQARNAALNGLLKQLFDPLEIKQVTPQGRAVRLIDAGEAMELPMPQGMPGIRLYWAKRGRRLFSRQDRRLATSMARMLDLAIARHREHEEAVENERSRINRDMHDNIGIQLLGALHSTDPARKDTLIRQTLSDLRQIISNPINEAALLSDLLADLRGEISEHLEAAGIGLTWQDGGLSHADTPEVKCGASQVQALRALLREGTSNIIRHSGASEARIVLDLEPEPGAGETPVLNVMIEDTGGKAAEPSQVPGNGLANLRHRIEGGGGQVTIAKGAQGTRLDARLPL